MTCPKHRALAKELDAQLLVFDLTHLSSEPPHPGAAADAAAAAKPGIDGAADDGAGSLKWMN